MGEKSENKLLTVALMQLHISTVAMYLYIYEYICMYIYMFFETLSLTSNANVSYRGLISWVKGLFLPTR